MFKSAFAESALAPRAVRGVAARIATTCAMAAVLLGSLEYARLAALPTHFV